MLLPKITEPTEEHMSKVLAKLHTCQRVYIEVLECPASRTMDCLLQLSGQVYTKFDALLDGKAFTKCVRSDLEMMQMQESKHCFNPVLANAV